MIPVTTKKNLFGNLVNKLYGGTESFKCRTTNTPLLYEN